MMNNSSFFFFLAGGGDGGEWGRWLTSMEYYKKWLESTSLAVYHYLTFEVDFDGCSSVLLVDVHSKSRGVFAWRKAVQGED